MPLDFIRSSNSTYWLDIQPVNAANWIFEIGNKLSIDFINPEILWTFDENYKILLRAKNPNLQKQRF